MMRADLTNRLRLSHKPTENVQLFLFLEFRANLLSAILMIIVQPRDLQNRRILANCRARAVFRHAKFGVVVLLRRD